MKLIQWEEKAASIWNKHCEDLTRIYEYNELWECVNNAQSIMDYRFGHIVWADGNYESHHIQWSLEQKGNEDYNEMLPFEKEVLVKSLQELLDTLPKYEDCVDYEENNHA